MSSAWSFSGDDFCGNYTAALNATGASLATIRGFGPTTQWCQHNICHARMSSKTLTAKDRYYPFFSLDAQINFIDIWTYLWAWSMFSLEILIIIGQIIDIYAVDQVQKQRARGELADDKKYHAEIDKASGWGRWATRWIGFLYIMFGIAEFVYFLASNQVQQPSANVFGSGNTILSLQMLIPVLFMANGMMWMWSSFVYRHNHSENVTASYVVPFLTVINVGIIGWIMIIYSNELDLSGQRTTVIWGGTFFIMSVLVYFFTLVYSRLGGQERGAVATWHDEQSKAVFRHLRLGLAVLWATAAALIGSRVPGNLVCALLNVNDKVSDNMVYIGFIALYAVIVLIIYFIYWAMTFSAAVQHALDMNKSKGHNCCDVSTILCCRDDAAVDLFEGKGIPEAKGLRAGYTGM